MWYIVYLSVQVLLPPSTNRVCNGCKRSLLQFHGCSPAYSHVVVLVVLYYFLKCWFYKTHHKIIVLLMSRGCLRRSLGATDPRRRRRPGTRRRSSAVEAAGLGKSVVPDLCRLASRDERSCTFLRAGSWRDGYRLPSS